MRSRTRPNRVLALLAPALPWALGLLSATALASCAARRTIRVESQPPGAKVRFDDRIVGVTPVEVPFEHYGTRRVTLYQDGYRTWSSLMAVRAPWYFAFPIDFVTEVVLPFGWKDSRTLRVELEPERPTMEQPDVASVLERAEIFRRAGPDGPRLEESKLIELPKAGEGGATTPR
jgi:hypothetical protein